MTNHIYLIIKREFLSRIKRKSFIFSTILIPVFFIGMMIIPSWIMSMSEPEQKNIAVIDNTGYISMALLDNGLMNMEITNQPLDSLKNREDLDAVLVIPADVIENPANTKFYTFEAPSPQTEMFVSGLLASAIEKEKLDSYNIPDLDKIIASVHTDVNMQTFRIDGENEQESSSTASYIIGLILIMVLYMFIMMYGQMVMTSIIEEKNNRVLEIVVSSVRPTSLMLGKILGIGAVAVTQIVIWAVLIGAFSFTVMPGLLTGAAGAGGDAEVSQLLSTVGDPGYLMGMFGMMALFLILGYLFYSAIYAAIGSAVDNIQDAGQLQMFALLPIIVGMLFSINILNDPGSTLAVTLSMIPFVSPEVMMARIPFGVDVWQSILSIAILVVSTLIIVWISAKIYRIGIFMYGKKPTIKDLWKWARE